jgi:phosphohistidine phosphatase
MAPKSVAAGSTGDHGGMSSPIDRHLILLRHAKSDWPAGVPDRERPLAGRGRAQAPLAGRWLAEQGLVPDLALVSSAARAQQTWDLVAAELGSAVPAQVDDAFYDAGALDMLERLRGLDDGVTTVLVVGHNPGTENLALLLEDGEGPSEQRARMAGKFPTSALAVLRLLVPRWADLDGGTARLQAFVVPR